MTDEDRQIIQGIVQAAVDAAVQYLNGRLDAAVQSLTAASTANLADLRTELLARFADVDRRLDRLVEIAGTLQTNMATLNRWADRLDKDQAPLGQN